MLFKKEFLQALVWDDCDPKIAEKIEETLEDTSRWSLLYSMVFQMKDTGKFYQTSYSKGATECQEESPYEYDSDEIECVEVVSREVTVTQYVPLEELR